MEKRNAGKDLWTRDLLKKGVFMAYGDMLLLQVKRKNNIFL